MNDNPAMDLMNFSDALAGGNDGFINIPLLIKNRGQAEFDLCLHIRSCIEGLIFLMISKNHSNIIDSPGICIYELLENTIRYSILGRPIRILARVTNEHIEIDVHNDTSEFHAKRVTTRINEMKKETPLNYYLSMMRRKPGKTESGGLGLARLYHDCKAELSVKTIYTRNNINVAIKAIIPIQ